MIQNSFSLILIMTLAFIFLGFLVIVPCGEVGLKLGNMAMALTIIEDEDSMALLPFGRSAFSVGRFIGLPQCGGPRRTDSPDDQDSPQDFVDAHNVARAQVSVEPLEWDRIVAGFAQQYANQRINDCRLVHSGGSYGENIAWSNADLSGKAAVQLWVNEKPFYDYDTNTCAPGKLCGHYTQVVWRN
ncbi:hypothetical protein IC575_000155 [Cucumis melo]